MKLNLLGKYEIEINNMRECRHCDKIFRKKQSGEVRCESCRNEWKSKLGTIQVCKYCNEKYIMNYLYYIFCDPECKRKYYERLYKGKNRLAILDRDNYQCIYCGKTSYGDNIKLHIDHIYPKSKGGEDIAGNLVTSCSECNHAKSAKIMMNIGSILNAVKDRNKANGIPDNLKIKLSNT